MPTPAELLNETERSPDVVGLDAGGTEAGLNVAERKGIFSAVVWTGLAFAVLQSVCTVLIGLGGARLVIGLLSAAAATSVFSQMDAFHRDGLRIPMLAFAVLGSALNLIVVAQVRRLRNRPAARWRLNAASLPKQVRQERWQVWLSLATLALVMVEEVAHHLHVHRW